MNPEINYADYLISRAAKHLVYANSVQIDTARVVKIAEDVEALVLPKSGEGDGLLLAAFSAQNPLFKYCLSQGSSATKTALGDCVLLWLDTVNLNDKASSFRRSAFAAFSYFHGESDNYEGEYFFRKVRVQLDHTALNCVAMASARNGEVYM